MPRAQQLAEYSNTALITALAETPQLTMSRSSSSMPGRHQQVWLDTPTSGHTWQLPLR